MADIGKVMDDKLRAQVDLLKPLCWALHELSKKPALKSFAELFLAPNEEGATMIDTLRAAAIVLELTGAEYGKQLGTSLKNLANQAEAILNGADRVVPSVQLSPAQWRGEEKEGNDGKVD